MASRPRPDVPDAHEPGETLPGPAAQGKLVLVSTPIGNLDDLSARALLALENADLIACEDTRHTGSLLHHCQLKRPLRSLHDHNEQRRIPELLALIAAGQTIVLVSDAGTPLVCDPGYRLVRAAIADGLSIETVPGPSAALAALTLSGLPPYPFTFAGFPPRKQGKRRQFFARLAELNHTVLFFESPHRLPGSLSDALDTFGNRPAALSREITKLHEETVRLELEELLDWVTSRERLRGEFVITIGGGN